MKILKRIKDIIKFYTKPGVPRVINDVWYNFSYNVSKETLGTYSHLRVCDDKGDYVIARLGNIHKYHFSDGREAYYKVTKIHSSSGGDYLLNSDRVNVDLKLYRLI